jgi:hypothetical protein
MKKDLDFASAEIERLRSKLVFDDDNDMPPLSLELMGSTKNTNKALFNMNNDNNEVEGPGSGNSENNTINLKKAISQV